ncbi:MAG: hypothetical protein H3C57_01970 [Gammaproteobacteria bacterium]|nr:hypothetical protein [Gammaproteobacteria bacterium]
MKVNKLRTLMMVAAVAAPLAMTPALAAGPSFGKWHGKPHRPDVRPLPGPGAFSLVALGLGVAFTIARRRS